MIKDKNKTTLSKVKVFIDPYVNNKNLCVSYKGEINWKDGQTTLPEYKEVRKTSIGKTVKCE